MAYKHRLLLGAAAALGAGSALAAGPVPTTIPGDSHLTTIYTLGDYKVLASAFNAVASFFNGGGAIGDSFMGQLLLLASMVSLFFFIAMGVGRMKMGFSAWFLTLVFGMVLFMPRTTVYTASYFDVNGGSAGGATPFEAVDNVPVGIAYPLGITSFVFKELTMRYDTWSTTPGGSADDGGFAEKGLEGYFSPLKTMLRVQKLALPPVILQNIRTISTCDGIEGRMAMVNEGGLNGALNMLDQGPGVSGSVRIKVKTADGYKNFDVPCATALRTVFAQMQAFVVNEAATMSSPMARSIVTSSGMGEAMGINKGATERAKQIQKELDGVVSQLLELTGASSSTSTAKTEQDLETIMTGANGNPAQMARAFENQTAVTAANTMANAVFSRVMAACGTRNSSECNQATYSSSEAIARGAVNAAGEASVFSAFMSHAMNALLYIYVILSPIILMVGVIMGVAGLKIWGAYLLFAAWINSWLPTAGAISAYMLHNYTNQVERIAAAAQSDALTSGGAFKIPSLLLPGGLNDFIFSTTNMLASASTLLSMVPMITLAIISGSIYGLVGVAQRMNMPDNFNEDRLAPKLDSSDAIGSSNDIKTTGRIAAAGEDAVAATQGAAAAADNSIDFKYSSAEQQQQATQLAQQVSAAKEHAEAEVNAFAKATGSQFQSMSGKMVTLRHDDGTTRTYDFSKADQVVDAAQNGHSKTANAQLGAQVGGEIGAGGKLGPLGAKGSMGASGGNSLGEGRANTATRTTTGSSGSSNSDGGGTGTTVTTADTSGYSSASISSAIRTLTSSTSDTSKYMTALQKQEAFTHQISSSFGMDARTSLSGADAQRAVAYGAAHGELGAAINAASSISPELGASLRESQNNPSSFTQKLFGAYQTGADGSANRAAASAAISEVAKIGGSHESSVAGKWETVQKAASQNAGLYGAHSAMDKMAGQTPFESSAAAVAPAADLKAQHVNTNQPGGSAANNPAPRGGGGGRSPAAAGTHGAPTGGNQSMQSLLDRGNAAVSQERGAQAMRAASTASQQFSNPVPVPDAPQAVQVFDKGGVAGRAADGAVRQVQGAFNGAAESIRQFTKPKK